MVVSRVLVDVRRWGGMALQLFYFFQIFLIHYSNTTLHHLSIAFTWMYERHLKLTVIIFILQENGYNLSCDQKRIMGCLDRLPTNRPLQVICRGFLPRKIDPLQLACSEFLQWINFPQRITSSSLEASLLTKTQQEATPIH
ncbi:hypothetical protein V6Z11_A11G352300 [Gossypium hirsutum]